MMNVRNKESSRTGVVMIDDWEQQIIDAYEQQPVITHDQVFYRNENFLDKIWEMSLHAF